MRRLQWRFPAQERREGNGRACALLSPAASHPRFSRSRGSEGWKMLGVRARARPPKAGEGHALERTAGTRGTAPSTELRAERELRIRQKAAGAPSSLPESDKKSWRPSTFPGPSYLHTPRSHHSRPGLSPCFPPSKRTALEPDLPGCIQGPRAPPARFSLLP